MKLLYSIVYVVLFFLLLFVLVQNAIDQVTLRFFIWKWEGVRLFVVLLGSAAVGALVGLLFSAMSMIRLKSDYRKIVKENKNLKEELDNLRNVSLDEIPDSIDTNTGAIVTTENNGEK
ncbi:MAG: hypothetical protein Kow00108_13370 [Calditrichia bacterium]